MSSALEGPDESEEYYLHLEHEEAAAEGRKTLADAEPNVEYSIRGIASDNTELKNFLFSLGCFKGETVTVISILAENFVISIKDARYSVDSDLAEAIII